MISPMTTANGLGPRRFAGFGGIHGGSRQAVGGRSGSACNGGLCVGPLVAGGALGCGSLGEEAPAVVPAGAGAGGTAPGGWCGCVSSVGSVILDILDPARRACPPPASPSADRARQPCDNPGSSR